MIPRAHLIRIAPWWVLCLVLGSFLPSSGKDALGTTNYVETMAAGRASENHRFAHFLAFGSTALLLALIANGWPRQVLGAFGIAILGLLIETSQFYFLNSFVMEWWDVRDDAIASVVGLLLAQSKLIRNLIVSHSGSDS